MEKFSPECPSDQVIVMDYARYGRMKLGRCIDRDYGYIDCFADVQDLVDMRCSGRRTCVINVPDQLLDYGTAACPKDLKHYLEANFTCLEGILGFFVWHRDKNKPVS